MAPLSRTAGTDPVNQPPRLGLLFCETQPTLTRGRDSQRAGGDVQASSLIPLLHSLGPQTLRLWRGLHLWVPPLAALTSQGLEPTSGHTAARVTVPLPQGSQREKPGRSIPVFIARNGSTKGHIQTAQLGARGPVQSSPTRYCSARGVAWFCSWRTMPRSSLYHQYPGQQLLTH